jgi:glutaredoxin 3
MPQVTVYTTDYCPFCEAAKGFLKRKNIPFEEIDVTDGEKKAELKAKTGWRTVPQIFIDGELIGGFQELMAWDASGDLEKRLKEGSKPLAGH